jgi:predicted RNA-binding protein YlqC (UPF0109 family)
MDALKSLTAFIDHAVAGLCDDPSLIKMESRTDEKGMLVTLTVPSSQMSKLIGRNGKTIKALTTLVRSMGQDLGGRAAVKLIEVDAEGNVVEPVRRERPERSPRKPKPSREFAPERNKETPQREFEPTKTDDGEMTLSADDIDI